jgi:hypothetical protein
MVNNMKNISQYDGVVPNSEKPELTISATTALYDENQVLALLEEKGANGFTAWTRGCISDLTKWELDHDEVLNLIRLCFRTGKFLGAEWCQQRPNGSWAACDAYRIFRNEKLKYADKDITIEYYLKFAISKTGQLLLLVSCHPSGT